MIELFLVILLNNPHVALLDSGDHAAFMRSILDANNVQYRYYDIGQDYPAVFDRAINDGNTVFLFPYILTSDDPLLFASVQRLAAAGTVYSAAGSWYDRVRPEYLPLVTIMGAYYAGPEPCPVVGEYERCPVTYLNNEQPEEWRACRGDYWGCSTSEAVARAVQ